jgi:hypothetical protein
MEIVYLRVVHVKSLYSRTIRSILPIPIQLGEEVMLTCGLVLTEKVSP